MILPPPVTSDCTLDHVEEFLDVMNAGGRQQARRKNDPPLAETGAPCAGDGDTDHEEQG